MALPEADYGLTESAFQGDAGRYAHDDVLLVKFFYHPRLQQTKSEEAQRPIYEDEAYIQIMQPGNKDSIVIRPAMEMDKQRFPDHWKKFLARDDQDSVQGTLLEEWPGITRSQVEELKFFNIRTVEQLAQISDSNAQNIMGIQMLKSKAETYLENSEKEALASDLAKKDEQIAELLARMERMEKHTDGLEMPDLDLETAEED